MVSESLPIAVQDPLQFRIETAFAKGVPYDAYAWFRAHDPIHTGEPREWGPPPVFLFRHGDVARWLRDQRLGKEWSKAFPPETPSPEPEPDSFHAVASRFMLFRDPPVHSHLRGLANMAFTPRQVNAMRPRIQELAADLMRDVVAEHDGEAVDLITSFAYPLPTLVIAGDMLFIGAGSPYYVNSDNPPTPELQLVALKLGGNASGTPAVLPALPSRS